MFAHRNPIQVGVFVVIAVIVWTAPAAAQGPTVWEAGGQKIPMWTSRYGQYLFVTDHPFHDAAAIAESLDRLAGRLRSELGVNPPRELVRFYLFQNRSCFETFVLHYMPTLSREDTSSRHGLFLLRNDTPHVFALVSGDLRKTLGHEFVHVTLNAFIPGIPIWLDEGLATFYEMEHSAVLHSQLFPMLKSKVRGGWRPDLRRLQGIRNMQQMGPLEYAEAWSWVHFLMSGPAEGRGLLQDYIAELRVDPQAMSLPDRFATRLWNPQARWLAYFASSLTR